MMARRYWEMPVIGWFSRRAGSFPVGDGRPESGVLKLALTVLAANRALGIFPEGGISPDGRVRPGREGAARLALRTGAPLVPAGIVGTRRAYPKGQLLPRPTAVLVRFGEPIFPPRSGSRTAERERSASLTVRLMERIAALAADLKF
jgi:1-acyl-sn-glycerol-3-phosphate acyltransferase